jgi:uncharacterized phage protein gp47/JayE
VTTEAFLFPMDYTSRDYLSLREDLINVIKSRIPEWQADDPTDFGVALVEAFAYMGDILNYYIDRAAAETFLGTAAQRQSLLNIASLLGYSPAGRTAATVPLLFVNNGSVAATIAAGSQVSTVIKVGDSNVPLTFEVQANPSSGDGSWSVGPSGGSALITAVEGITITNKILGMSTGYSSQALVLRDYPLINRSLSIRIGSSVGASVAYTYVQNLYDATPTDKVFTYRTDDRGVTTVIFGDGVSGAVPPLGQNVYATYRLGGGVLGNISHGLTFSPVGFTFPGTITNQVQATGGADEESNEHIRQSAFAAFRTRNSAVTKQDFQDLALADNRVSKSKARGNSFGNILVYVAPTSSGDRKTDPQPGYDAYNVVSKARSGNVVTLVLAETPQFTTAMSIDIAGMGSPYDGTATRAVTLTDAGDLVTLNGHGMLNGYPVVFESITSTTGISAGTTYYVVSSTTNTFQVSATVGGTALALTTNGSGVLRGVGIVANAITYTVGSLATVATTPASGIANAGELSAFATTRAAIQADLQSKGVVGTIVSVYPPRYYDIAVTVDIGVKPQFRQTTAVAAVKTALGSLFNYNAVGFNQSVRPQELLASLINMVEEIQYATVTLYASPGGSSTTLVQSSADQILRLLDGNLTVTVNVADPGIAA